MVERMRSEHNQTIASYGTNMEPMMQSVEGRDEGRITVGFQWGETLITTQQDSMGIQDIPRSKQTDRQTDGKDGSSVSLCDSFSAFLSLFFFHFLCQNLVHVYACHSCIWSCVSFDGVHNGLRDLLLIYNVMLIRAVISHLILLLTA